MLFVQCKVPWNNLGQSDCSEGCGNDLPTSIVTPILDWPCQHLRSLLTDLLTLFFFFTFVVILFKLLFKVLGFVRFVRVLEDDSYAHQGCSKNTVKTEIL